MVATVVHHPADSRIFHRQIQGLLAEGHEVVYIAPFADWEAPSHPRLRCRSVPRSVGKHRIRPLRAAAQALAEETMDAQVTIVHDPELTVLDRHSACPVVVDVHEDLRSQLADKAWIPVGARWLTRGLCSLLEARTARRFAVLVAEESYLAWYPEGVVVRNTPVVPEVVADSGNSRLVYLGRVSRGRGLETMVEAMEQMGEERNLDLFGPVDLDDQWILDGAVANVVAHGFVEGPVALREIEGAMAGLSLLRDLPNYRHSMPTKILEYMAHGLPVITTPLPLVAHLIEDSGAGAVVPFDDPGAVAEAVAWLDDPEVRARCAANGRQLVERRFDWQEDSKRFMEHLYMAASGSRWKA